METFGLVSLCAQGHSTHHTCSFMLLRLGFSPWTQVNLLPQHLECWDHRPAPCVGCPTRALCGDTHVLSVEILTHVLSVEILLDRGEHQEQKCK